MTGGVEYRFALPLARLERQATAAARAYKLRVLALSHLSYGLLPTDARMCYRLGWLGAIVWEIPAPDMRSLSSLVARV